MEDSFFLFELTNELDVLTLRQIQEPDGKQKWF
ncbi:hypothetical protein ABID96_001849 [Bacillus sp. OAE603]